MAYVHGYVLEMHWVITTHARRPQDLDTGYLVSAGQNHQDETRDIQ
jgi:hypothetical protein